MSNEHPKTIRIRVAVAVHPDGRWSAAGSDFAECRPLNLTYRFRKDAQKLSHFWIDVDVPTPVVGGTLAAHVSLAATEA